MMHRMMWFGFPPFRFSYFGSLSTVLMILFLMSVTALVLAVIAFVRTRKNAPYSTAKALSILAERRAREEITQGEFDALRNELRKK